MISQDLTVIDLQGFRCSTQIPGWRNIWNIEAVLRMSPAPPQLSVFSEVKVQIKIEFRTTNIISVLYMK